VIVHPLEDLAAICGAETPEELWLYLVARPTLRAFPNDFDAVAAFKTLHGNGTPEAMRTAGLLCTDLRWRRCTTTLVGRVEDSGILAATELDELSDAWLWEDHYYWPVPGSWLRQNWKLARQVPHSGSEQVSIERHIWPPLRKWSARRIATEDPDRSGDVLERITGLDSRDGDAAMAGLLDAAEGFSEVARSALVELGCQWGSGSVRHRALQLLAAWDPERAEIMAANDASEVVRRQAGRFQQVPVTARDDSDESVAPGAVERTPLSNQLALFG
jgi:hypothetical protein